MPSTLRAALALALLLTLLPAAALAQADPVAGAYAVTGWEPGAEQSKENAYTGTAEIRALGDGYTFSADMDGSGYEGVGIYDPQTGVLSLGFHSLDGVERGVTTLGVNAAGDLEGPWMPDSGDGTLGYEVWRRN